MEHKDSRLKVLLFDLGSILLRLNSLADIFGLQMSEEEFLQFWIHSPNARQYECGSIDVETFAVKVILEVDLLYDATEFLDPFKAWPGEMNPRIPELLDRIPAVYSTALLSNTNAIHCQQPGVASVLEKRIDRLFLSFATGRIKPNADAYEYARAAFRCTREVIAFFDDNPTNVDASNSLGYNAYLTRSVDEPWGYCREATSSRVKRGGVRYISANACNSTVATRL